MKFKRPLKITSRTSSLTNAFVQAIIPWELPSDAQRAEICKMLDTDPNEPACCYCGGKATDWDHLRPLVRGKRPTGYTSDYRNLVPSCGPCNQSKSGAEWRPWMTGKAKGSPATRKVGDLANRVEKLAAYEAWGDVEPFDFADAIGAELWATYWAERDAIEALMFKAQETASKINSRIASHKSQLGP